MSVACMFVGSIPNLSSFCTLLPLFISMSNFPNHYKILKNKAIFGDFWPPPPSLCACNKDSMLSCSQRWIFLMNWKNFVEIILQKKNYYSLFLWVWFLSDALTERHTVIPLHYYFLLNIFSKISWIHDDNSLTLF